MFGRKRFSRMVINGMNWFKAHIKLAYPYSYNLCPECAQSLLIDFYWERYGEGNHLGIGQCPVCHTGFMVEEFDQEENLGFKYSKLVRVSPAQFKHLSQVRPNVLVVKDDDNSAVAPADPDQIQYNQEQNPSSPSAVSL